MACLELCIRLIFGHVLDGLPFLIKNKKLLDADLSGGVKGLGLCPHIGAVEGHQSHWPLAKATGSLPVTEKGYGFCVFYTFIEGPFLSH